MCIGHDSLFFKYAKGLTTVLVAKDRVLGHNPLPALQMGDRGDNNPHLPLGPLTHRDHNYRWAILASFPSARRRIVIP